MLANQEDFDRHVKRVLQEVKGEEVPIDFLVDIEQRLDQLEKKKKRRALLWFFMGIVLASGLSFGLLRENGTTKSTVTIAQQNLSNQASKPKVLQQLASSKGNRTTQTTNVQSASVSASSVVSRAIPSGLPEKATITRLGRKNQSDVMHSTKPLAGIESSPALFTRTEIPQDEQGIISDEKKVFVEARDSAQSVRSIKEEVTREEVFAATKIPEITMNNSLPKWTRTFGFYTGMSGVISSFQTNDVSLISAVGVTNALKYRELRSTQERSTSSIDISLRYRMVKKHLVLQTGVDFFEWGEQIQYDYSFTFDGVNRYSYLSLPVYLGYRQAFQSFEWGVNIGCSVGHVLQQKGRYIQPDLTTLASENARTWTATGLAQVELIYIFDRYRFTLAPTYRMSLGNVVNSMYTKNRYFSLGLQMGIAYQF
jgi:hypothetical protein